MKSSSLCNTLIVRLLVTPFLLGTVAAAAAQAQVNFSAPPTLAGSRKVMGGRTRRRTAKQQVQNGPEQVLYAFQGGSDGSSPSSGLIFDSSGNLYGTTAEGGGGACTNGFAGCGTVFELSPNGSGGWMESMLYSFQGGSDGASPSSGLIFDQAGNLYGTASHGGVFVGGNDGLGTVFELSPNGSGGWTESVLYSFQGGSDGEYPQGLIFDQRGNLYGTTSGGGGTCGKFGVGTCGTVFELSPNGSGGWTETLIYVFQSSDGIWNPNPGLVFDEAGNLYGTTPQTGGSAGCFNGLGCGAVFELSPNGSGGWREALLYAFRGGSDGGYPTPMLIFDRAGNLYDTAEQGGQAQCPSTDFGCGTVFELSPNGSGGWTKTTLYSFQGGSDGWNPQAGLIFDETGNLFGTTSGGGMLRASERAVAQSLGSVPTEVEDGRRASFIVFREAAMA
jgi:hypothetical protein